LLKHNSRDHNLAACTSRDDEESTSRLQSKPPGTDNSRHDDKNSNLPLKRKRNTPVESIAPCERGKSPLPTARHIGSEKTKKTEPHREIKKPHVTINQGCEWLRRVKGTKGRNPKTQISVTPLIGDDCLSKLYRRDQVPFPNSAAASIG
jgi:hypothetical protein